MIPSTPSLLRVCTVLGVLAVLLLPALVRGGKHSMIPPGQEQRIRTFVDEGIELARAAGELPVELDETVDIHIERDRVSVTLHPRAGVPSPELPQLVLFHPQAVPEDARGGAASGVLLRCGPPPGSRECEPAEAEPWRALAGRLADARAPVADLVWQLDEQDATPRSSSATVGPRRSLAWVDRGAAILVGLAGLWLAWFGARENRRTAAAIRWPELAALALLLLAFVGATVSVTSLLPLHEHNSFIARSDCAIDDRCLEDPASAWNLTTLHVYGLVLSLVPYRAAALSSVSLGCSVVVLVLVWALARTLMRALGRPELGAVAGLSAVAVLACHPVAWRLAGSATFWPWALAWTLAGAVAGLWASQAAASRARVTRIAGGLAWVVAAGCWAIACGGNFVLLTLGTCLVLAPLCWTAAWSGQPAQPWRAAAIRAAAIGGPALLLFALVASHDYLAGYARAFGESGLDDSITLAEIRRRFNPLLLDGRISARVWVLPLVCSLAWLWPGQAEGRRLHALRTVAPLVYAWLVPAAFLGLAAGEVVGSGYPVGFINHHWELCFTALWAGLGVAWIVGALERRWPGRLRYSVVVPVTLASLAIVLGPRASEGWRLATGERVLERELLALELAFTQLPEHDVLVIPPRLLEPTTDGPTQWDPLEVVFPAGFYAHAMRERGLEPAPIIELDRLAEQPPAPGARVLFYLGSSLRSFQPHEIEAGAVDDSLERPPLLRLRDEWTLERVHEFVVRGEQHEAISQRLGADRRPELELGFYWLRRRE
ncbi:hypothetical protein [Enhygromyxa salina]|uniref:Uncharacterized protein n=1 Tax=Enhygromyxa salina TaxID=215803 RepID=A0A2S9YWR2_9BACT|nr:hypothetical protein [Enhygromyxa salina]PRQ09530.1 hypothetical protein ENSA7_07720 [Enhygromyxa salina]